MQEWGLVRASVQASVQALVLERVPVQELGLERAPVPVLREQQRLQPVQQPELFQWAGCCRRRRHMR